MHFAALTAERGLSDKLSPSGLKIVSDIDPAFCMRCELIWLRCSGAAAGGALAAPSGGQRTLLRLARLGGDKLHVHPPAALLLLELCAIGVASRPDSAMANVEVAILRDAFSSLTCRILVGDHDRLTGTDRHPV